MGPIRIVGNKWPATSRTGCKCRSRIGPETEPENGRRDDSRLAPHIPPRLVGTIGRENPEPYLATGDYYAGVFYTLEALVYELTSDPDRINEDGYDIEFLRIDYWQLAIAIGVLVGVGILTKGRVFFWIGAIITRGKFGGGRSGGGGARGRF